MSSAEVEDIWRRLGFAYTKVQPLEKVLEVARSLEGKAYKYGASISYDAPDAFDCSSLVAYVFAQAGIGLPRQTVDQYVFGTAADENDLEPGDVVFSRNDKGADMPEYQRVADGAMTSNESIKKASKDFLPGTEVPEGVSHNGIYLGDGKVLHASAGWHKGKVLIEDMATSEAFEHIIGHRRMIADSEERYVVTIPPERLDLQATRGYLVSGNKQDLIEEVGRVYGYNNIKAEALVQTHVPEVHKGFYYGEKIRDLLVGKGFSEVYTYSFGTEGDIALANPLAKDRPVLRASLHSGLKKTLEEGMYYKDFLGESAIRVFEIGAVFTKEGEYVELGIGLAGKKQGKIESELTEIQEVLSDALGVKVLAPITDGIVTINFTALLEQLPEPASYDDIKHIDTSAVVYTPLSSYPFVLRDIAVWIPKTVLSPQSQVISILEKEAGELLVKMTLFDTFEKAANPADGQVGRISYAYRLVFQSYEKTLSDEEINPIMEKITKTLNAQEGWEVR